jgi:uncharacterized membrane protein YbaN (DUF454 family)
MGERPARRTVPFWLRISLAILGFVCIVIGIAGVVLPVLPGIPFLAVAYFLLVPEFPWLASPVVKALRRWPKIRRATPKRFRRRPPRPRGEK